MWQGNNAFNLRVSDSARKKKADNKRPESSALFRRRKLLSHSERHLFRCRGFRPITTAEIKARDEEKVQKEAAMPTTQAPYVNDADDVQEKASEKATSARRATTALSAVSTIPMPKSSRVRSTLSRSKSSEPIRKKSSSKEPIRKSSYRDRAVNVFVSGSGASSSSKVDGLGEKLPEGASVVVQERIVFVTPPTVTVTSPSPTTLKTPSPLPLAQIANSIKPMVPYNERHARQKKSSTSRAASPQARFFHFKR